MLRVYLFVAAWIQSERDYLSVLTWFLIGS